MNMIIVVVSHILLRLFISEYCVPFLFRGYGQKLRFQVIVGESACLNQPDWQFNTLDLFKTSIYDTRSLSYFINPFDNEIIKKKAILYL